MHFYLVLMYHLFLAMAHACFGAIRPAEIQVGCQICLQTVLPYVCVSDTTIALFAAFLLLPFA